MSFMQRQVEHGKWYMVETNEGTECVPGDVCSVPHIELGEGEFTKDSLVAAYTDKLPEGHTDTEWEIAETKGEDEWAEVVSALRDYVSGRNIQSVELREGWGARLSAPGYMDCTEWSVHNTKEEAEACLEEMYGDDEDEEEHEHQWGPLEESRLAGTWHRKCQVEGCNEVNALDEDDTDAE